METPYTITATPDYLLGVEKGQQVRVPVGADMTGGRTQSETISVLVGTQAQPAGAITLPAGLSVPGTVAGAGFSNYLLSPPAIGTTTPGVVKTSNLQMAYTDSAAAATGAPTATLTNNSPRGRFLMPIGASAITVTNSLTAATSMAHAELRSQDGTLTRLVSTVTAAGNFTLTFDGVATTGGLAAVDFMVVN